MNVETVESAGARSYLPPSFTQLPADCDDSLVAQAKSGSSTAFGELYERHRQRIYRAAFRIVRNEHDAEDTVQRSFQRAFINLNRFREDSAFSTWMTRIVINEALMLLRRRRTSQVHFVNNEDTALEDAVFDVADGGPSPEQILCDGERRAALLDAVGQLRKNLRVVVHHRELLGLSNAETAQLLGLTVSAVKARTFHARLFLKKHIARKLAKPGPPFRLRKA
jgi:RNA polymerase sigma-70 factor, ECF subfamily